MTKATIMIVEDEAITAKALQISIESMGCMVTSVVKTGEHAIKNADKDRPDLILMDIHIEGQMDGIEAAGIIRSRFDIPSVFLTAYADQKDLDRAKLVMPFGYIIKPFQDKDLKVTIDMGLYAARINSKRIKAEKALQKSYDTLEKRVEERTAELVLSNKQLKHEIDIRAQVEKKLLASEKKFFKIFKLSPVGIIITRTEDGKVIDVNESAVQITGYTFQEAIGRTSTDIGFWKNPGDREIVVQKFKKKGRIRNIEFEFENKSGQTRFGLFSVEAIDLDKVPCMITTILDITEAVALEKSLKKRYKEMHFLNNFIHQVATSLSFNNVVTSSIDGINEIIQPDLAVIFIHKDGKLSPVKYTSDNQEFFNNIPVHNVGECLCGMAVSNGKPQYSIDINDDIRCTRQECKKAGFHSFAALPLFSKGNIIGILGLASIKERDFKKDSLFIELLANEIAVGIQNSLLYQDIAIHEERFRIAAESASDLIYEWDIETDHLKWFGDINETLGLDPDEFENTLEAYRQLIHPDDIDKFDKETKKQQKNKEVFCINYRTRKKDGGYLFWENRGRSTYNDAGKAEKVIGVCSDITEKTMAEKALKKSKHLLQAVFDGISDPLIMLAKDATILKMNKAARSYYGVEFKDAINSKCYEVFKDGYTPCEDCRVPSIIPENKAVIFERKGFMDPERDEQVLTYPVIKSSVESGTIIRISDITEEKQARVLLARADRLSSLGQLSGGIAHEIRNPLGGIKLFLDVLSDEDTYNRTETEIEIFDEINANINKIDGIIKRVLAFAKPGETQMESVDINEIINESLKLFTTKLRNANINSKLSLDKSISTVKGDFIGLQQVITNLVLNAIEAMDNGGTLSIKTCGRKSSLQKERRVIAITIKDTGVGIKQNEQENIFNPFFTTKPTGTGLGLAISHQIVGRHGGMLSFKSKPGKGTTFSIELPDIKGI